MDTCLLIEKDKLEYAKHVIERDKLDVKIEDTGLCRELIPLVSKTMSRKDMDNFNDDILCEQQRQQSVDKKPVLALSDIQNGKMEYILEYYGFKCFRLLKKDQQGYYILQD